MRRTPRSPLFPYTTLFRSSSSCSTVVRENCGAVAVWVRVDQIEGLIVGIDAQYGQDWSKDFFVVDRHICGYVIKQRWPNKEPIAIGVKFALTAVHNHGGAFLFPGINVACDFIAVFRGHQRTHIGAAGTVTGAQVACTMSNFFNKFIGDF